MTFSTNRDETPFFSPDGKTLYFGSERPIEGRQCEGNFVMNIWQVEWYENKWGNPKPLSPTVNAVQVDKEEWPSSNENFIFSLNNINFIYTTMIRRAYYDNGQLKDDFFWLQGKKQGLWTSYTETGVLFKTEIYDDNKLVSTPAK